MANRPCPCGTTKMRSAAASSPSVNSSSDKSTRSAAPTTTSCAHLGEGSLVLMPECIYWGVPGLCEVHPKRDFQTQLSCGKDGNDMDCPNEGRALSKCVLSAHVSAGICGSFHEPFPDCRLPPLNPWCKIDLTRAGRNDSLHESALWVKLLGEAVSNCKWFTCQTQSSACSMFPGSYLFSYLIEFKQGDLCLSAHIAPVPVQKKKSSACSMERFVDATCFVCDGSWAQAVRYQGL